MLRVSQLIVGVICVLLAANAIAQPKVWRDEEETSEFWINNAQRELETALEKETLNQLTAKNVIMFLGDGMGIPTVTAGRILKGQMNGQTGEEFQLAMDKFPHAGLSRTYSVDRQTTDSAATATAYLCGVKSKHGTIGLSGMVERLNCSSGFGHEVDSILVDAYKDGKSTGVVSTVHLVHASPAGAYAHVAERNWFSDTRLTDNARSNGCPDIAKQFYESSNMITVALSGGRTYFRPTSVNDEEYPRRFGERLDGNDFIQQWIDDAGSENRQYVWNRDDMLNLDSVSTDRLLGLFEPEQMDYDIDRDNKTDPSLAEMVQTSIEILRKNENGYFLFVEGGKIDQGHHDDDAVRALYDLVAFDDAIEKAVSMTSETDTLIVVTADHSHTMSFGGYTWRGNPVFGKAPYDNIAQYVGLDGKPYTSILYNNGPAYQGGLVPVPATTRENLTSVATDEKGYRHQSGVPHASESHGGEDVTIFASGPMAHLFHGVHEQNFIPHAMKYAACIGDNKEHCSAKEYQPSYKASKASQIEQFSVQFLNLNLDIIETSVALYVQFVIVLSLGSFLIFFLVLIYQKQHKSSKELLVGDPPEYNHIAI